MAGLLKRLLTKTAKKATKKVVKQTPKVKPSTAAQRAALRTKAQKAAKTKVNIPNPGRKVGQQATLNGKTVYWGGKDFGWQSKASLTKITNGTKAKPKVTGKPAKPKYASAPPKRGDAPKGTRDSANGSRTVTARGRSAQKLREKAAAKRTGKPKTNTRVRTEADTGRKVATAPGVKRPPGSPKRGTNRPTQLTARERQRALLTKNRDIGAKAAAAKTPKSTRKTVSQAGGPVNKGRDVKNSTDLTARQRDGKSKSYGSAKQPKGTNPRQVASGRVRTSGEDKANSALKKFNVEKRILDMKEKFSAKNSPNLTGAERQAKIRAETKKLRTQAKGLRAQVQDKVKRQTDAARFNQSPGKSDRSDQVLGRDWRNRLSDSSAQRHSEHMTRIRSGKSVRTNGELVQTPKGKGKSTGDGLRKDRSANERSRTGTGRYSAKGSGGNTPASTSKGLKKATDTKTTVNKGKGYGGNTETSVTRPKPRKGTTQRKDTAYQPKGAAPSVQAKGDSVTQTGVRSSKTGQLLNQQGPKRKPARVDMESKARTGGKPASGPQAKMDAERLKEKKAMKALRERQTKPKPRTSRLRPAEQRRNAGMQSRMNASDAARRESEAAFKRGASGQGSW